MPPQNTMSAKRRSTSDRILEAARTLFSERGYEATTVRAIAAAAQVSAATVILYGDSKEALFESLYRTEVDRIFADALASAPPPAPLPIQLAHVFSAMITFFAAEPAAARVLLRLRLFEDDDAERSRNIRNSLTALVQRAQSSGRARGDLNPELVASTALHLYTGCITDMLRDPQADAESTIHRLRSMLRLLEEGMSPWR
jgi:AcrR family transcriptional regulator